MNSLFSLAGRTAVVTGSSQGIGKSIADALQCAGARVFRHGLHEKEDPDFIAWDFNRPASGCGFAEALRRRGAEPDIAVLNVSIQSRRAISELPAAEVEEQFRVNFQSNLEMLQAFVEPMRRRKWGRILVIGSVQIARPHPHMLAYAATKCALLSMVANAAAQVAADGVTLNMLSPGVIETSRNEGPLAVPEIRSQALARIPAGHFGSGDDCAGAALLLCSEAGRYITGVNLYVDGGMHL